MLDGQRKGSHSLPDQIRMQRKDAEEHNEKGTDDNTNLFDNGGRKCCLADYRLAASHYPVDGTGLLVSTDVATQAEDFQVTELAAQVTH